MHRLSQYGVALAWPVSWRAEPQYMMRFGNSDGFVQVSASSGAPADVVAASVSHPLHPFGTHPTVRHLVVDGRHGFLLIPSRNADQLGLRFDMIVVAYHHPAVIGGFAYSSLVIWVSLSDVRTVARTISFLANH